MRRPAAFPVGSNIFSRSSDGSPEYCGLGGSEFALARRLIELNGGVSEGCSEGPDQGIELVIKLPIDETEVESSTHRARSREPAAIRGRRILVVDDNSDVANSLRVLLEAMGHQARTLNAGDEVLQLVREWQPEVVFLDIAMPDMDGYQVAAAIRAWSGRPPPLLVALTGYGQESDPERAGKDGFDHHMLKPPSPAEITAVLVDLD